jgi:hypothetical protein
MYNSVDNTMYICNPIKIFCLKTSSFHEVSVAQLVGWQIRDLKEVGSSQLCCFWRCRCRIRSGINLRQMCRTQRQAERRAEWPGTVRHPPSPPPPRLYFLDGVTRGANFYGLYYFAFLECALPGVNPRPQFGQCKQNQI